MNRLVDLGFPDFWVKIRIRGWIRINIKKMPSARLGLG